MLAFFPFSRYIDRKVPTYNVIGNFSDSIVEKYLEKTYLLWKESDKDMHEITVFH